MVGTRGRGGFVPGAGTAAALALAAWYVATMARGLEWFDSAELALVGRQLGLGHPPGQPLYTWLAGLFARLPGLDPLVGVNLLSALCAAACAIPADALLRRATTLRAPGRFLVLLAAGAAAPVWDQASRIELYSLSTLLYLGVLAVASGDAPRRWALAGLLVGALASVNPVFALGAALSAGLQALPGLLRRRALLPALGAAIGGTLLGLLPYLHLFLVGAATDRLVWGELGTARGVIAYLTGADYAMTEHAAFADVPRHVGAWLAWAVGQGTLAPLAGLLGWGVGPGLRRHLVLLGVAVLFGFGFTATYGAYFPEIPDFNGYLAPALWLAALGLAGLAEGATWRLALPALALALTLSTGERPVWERSRAGLRLPDELAARSLDAAEPGAVLLVESDHLFFPMLYLQEAEGRRPDVVLINVGWSASSWYWRHLYARHPELPPIPLAAPDRPTRLRRLLEAMPGRPARAESLGLAAALHIRPCPATWGFALGPACAATRDDEAAFLAQLDAWWTGPAGRDPLSVRVLASLAEQRAAGLWALGDEAGALRAWRAGIPPDRRGAALDLPPVAASGQPRPPLTTPPDVLIGSPEVNRASGAAALAILGWKDAAERWLAAP